MNESTVCEGNIIKSPLLSSIFSFHHRYAWKQQIANGILMATAAAIGLLCYFLGETKQRRAFLEAKQSLEVKMVIEEQSAEQVKEKHFFFKSEKST